jgi:hypothetical protein
MAGRATALTAAAGEHFVAYKLSALGYPVAMTRGGSPTVDLMVGDLSGKGAISIQVKTSNWAARSRKKDGKKWWEWDVGRKALELRGDSIFYSFVDLRWDPSVTTGPEVYIVPSAVVANFVKPDWSRFMFWIYEEEQAKCHDRWDLIQMELK